MEAHEPNCDQQHTPRQRCNRALEIQPHAADAIAVPEPVAAPGAERSPLGDGEPVVMTLQRDVIAATEMTQPTRYVAEEWDKTAAAVVSPIRDGATPAFDTPSPFSSVWMKATVAAVLVVIAAFVLRKR